MVAGTSVPGWFAGCDLWTWMVRWNGMIEPSGWVAMWAGTRDLDGLVAAGLLADNMRPCRVCGSEPVGSWAVQYRCW